MQNLPLQENRKGRVIMQATGENCTIQLTANHDGTDMYYERIFGEEEPSELEGLIKIVNNLTKWTILAKMAMGKALRGEHAPEMWTLCATNVCDHQLITNQWEV